MSVILILYSPKNVASNSFWPPGQLCHTMSKPTVSRFCDYYAAHAYLIHDVFLRATCLKIIGVSCYIPFLRPVGHASQIRVEK